MLILNIDNFTSKTIKAQPRFETGGFIKHLTYSHAALEHHREKGLHYRDVN